MQRGCPTYAGGAYNVLHKNKTALGVSVAHAYGAFYLSIVT